MELAYARSRAAEPSADPGPELQRPSLTVVPDLESMDRPPLPHRPSRRAVVRAQVWGVPISRRQGSSDPVEEREADSRIAEAVRLLAGL